MAKRYAVEFNAKVTPIKPINDEFTLCKCYVMALNKNRNLSYIGQDAADAALPSLFNVPVIGHLLVDEDGNYHMGGHDMAIVRDSDGTLRFKSLCVPYGVVPQQDSVHYEDIKDANGDTWTYLVADVILWTGRFPELLDAIYSEETYFGQSMEINVEGYEPLDEDKNYTNILSYTYSALCLLGKSDNPEEHTEPCFPCSRVDPYEFSLDDDKFSELMSELKSELAFCFDNNAAKKGEEGMEDIQATAIAQDEAAADETTAFETAAPDVCATTQPEMDSDLNDVVSMEANIVEKTDERTAHEFSFTYGEKRDALRNAMPEQTELDDDGNVIRAVSYWVCDFDDTNVYVERSEWSRGEGCDETKGKFTYEFNEAEKTVALTSEFVAMFVTWLTKEEAEQLEAMRNQYEALVAYKNSRELADRNAAMEEAVAEFADLEGNDAFAAVLQNKDTYETIDAFKDACYIIRGKFSAPSRKAKPAAEPSVPVVGTHTADTGCPIEHEAFFARYHKVKK